MSLTTTSIETIESTFQPPDISPDMYDRDNELDTDWLEFLNVLTKPISELLFFGLFFCSTATLIVNLILQRSNR